MRLILILAFLISALPQFGQLSDEWRLEFRKLYLEEHPDLASELNALFSNADSLRVSDKIDWLSKMESFTADTTLSPNYYKLPFELEKHFYFQSKNKIGLAMNSLKLCQSLLQNENAQHSLYKKTNDYLVQEFEASGEHTFAITSLKRLLDAAENSNMSLSLSSAAESDSLKAVIQLKEKNSLVQQSIDFGMRKMLLQGLAAAGLLFVILLVIYFMSRWSSKKKIKALIEKQKDTTELDNLAKKIEVLKSESQQFKHTAQLTVNKLNGMDASGRKAATELQSLQTEILKSLEELRQQCEHNKASISPPVFMALQNVATRLGNSSTEKIQAISELLK